MSSSFSPTQAELALVAQIFAQTDSQKLGILKGDDAVRIFGGAKLAPTLLGEIWSIADEDNNGWLSRKSTAAALRLIAWAQKGEKVSKDLISKRKLLPVFALSSEKAQRSVLSLSLIAGPVPVIEGLSPIAAQHTGMSIPKSPPPTTGMPPLTQADKTKFYNMFVKAGPVNGLLSADQARDLFVKSKLPNDTLLQIWNLADTQSRGALDATDFALGMYFIQGVMSKNIANLPESLPPGLYQQAQMAAAPISQNHTGTRSPSASSFPPNRPPIQPNYTGPASSILKPQGTGMGALSQQNTGMLQPNNTGMAAQKRVPPSLPARPSASQAGSSFGGVPQWEVTAAEKVNSDRYFDTLDPNKNGFIEGDVAVPFMLESKLPDDVLAHIWDLSDLYNNGRLTKECFAVAMHLIQKKLNGGELPESLPESLMPPAMRTNGSNPFPPPSTGTGRPAPPPPVPKQPAPEPTKDLFSFDDTPPASATSNGPFSVPVQSTGSQPSAFSSPVPPATPHDPFGGAARDLLSDDEEPHSSPALHDRSAEIGNTQNQLNSTNRSLETAKTERANIDDALANQAVQLSSLQTQLSVAKAAYETETKSLAALKERHANQTAEIQKSRQELITAESDLSAVRVEKAEIEGAFMRDKEEARELHRKMIEAGKEAEALKAETEKAKKDAKQQKGLLAIAKKQLSSKEAERAKAVKELEEANAEAAALTKEREETEAELEKLDASPLPAAEAAIPKSTSPEPFGTPAPERTTSSDSLSFAATQPLPTTPDPASPSGGSTKSNNPFERLARTGSPRPQSPFLPFANASISTPPIGGVKPVEEKPVEKAIGDVSDDDDPFGFSQMGDGSPTPQAAPAPQASKGETPASLVIDPALGESLSSPASATEDFTTPPSTATLPVESPPRQTTLETTASKFPDLNSADATPALSSVAEGKKKAVEPEETDLGSSLKELEVEESDSSDEEDEVPLAAIQKRLSTDVSKAAKPETASPAAPSSFDDIFGTESNATGSPTPAAKTDAFGLPAKENGDAADVFGTPEMPTTISHVASPTEAGVNAFDEAMGKISPNPAASSNTPNFSFDTAFDDNFDFGAAGGTSFPPPTANGHATSGGDGFDSLFASQPAASPAPAASIPSAAPAAAASPVPASAPAPAPAPTSSTMTTNTQSSTGPSFDEVFSGFGSAPSLALDGTASGPQSSATSSPVQPAAVQEAKQAFPPSAGASPRLSTGSGDQRSISPTARAKSPVPRTSSPKPYPRPSTASSIGGGLDKPEKTPPTRHSKLSIRLPFGRKKKDKDAPPVPPPASLLTPPQEEPDRRATPASDDDVEAVKQLTAMGFSRSQAVDALERYGYDIPRALNSLLGQG
ncbi:hypothetical protein V5O48_003739 [Marasmius crinis-equi]|uniref:Uncharacterized protein n=1 Tax=Marasmius crinis-equi TaxID=585013 RepID=A0ABR3FS82_9AGAR